MKTMRERVIEYVRETYSVEPDYPFKGLPDCPVFRHSATRKWFGLIMDVKRSRLGLQGDDTVAIIDIKCPPLLAGSLRTQEGILPGYHMNKDSWITVLLDGSVPAETVFPLIDMSFDLTRKQVRRKKQDPTD